MADANPITINIVLPREGWRPSPAAEAAILKNVGVRATAYVVDVRPGVSLVVSRSALGTFASLDVAGETRALPEGTAKRLWTLAVACVGEAC
jgi:hypothetical protein